ARCEFRLKTGGIRWTSGKITALLLRATPFGSKAATYFGAGEVASFWKRGSFRSGSNIGSSWRSAGVSGPQLKGRRTRSRVVSVKRRWRGRALPSAPPPERGSRATKDQSRGLSRSDSRPSPAPTEPTRQLCHRDPY